ncbi:MAG TPA: response regulator transcription factor [Thermoanaerobaculia bacterium]
MRILIVDDHALFRDGLRSLLQSQGHEVVGEAPNGKAAVELATTRLRADLVLMDISMPELDGVAATKELTAHLPDV